MLFRSVVGTAPTSVMFITKFVYRYSWKTNIYNIKPISLDSIPNIIDPSSPVGSTDEDNKEIKKIGDIKEFKNTKNHLEIGETLGLINVEKAAEVIAVGDGANDLDMLRKAGTGVALHAKPSVAEQCDIRINFGDLTALLFIQGYSKEDFVI